MADKQPELLMIDIGNISANEYNPSEMEEAMFESFVAQIRNEGQMNQPILVRADPANKNKFIVIDGEHRWKASKVAGLDKIMAVLVDYDETESKVKTLSYNAMRGHNIPIKLAKIIADLQRTYTPAQIRQMTGIADDEQATVLKLLASPELRTTTGPRLRADRSGQPTIVPAAKDAHILLDPAQHASYTAAMKSAMNLAGDEVVALVGQEVTDFNKALSEAMGIAGVKLRNVALASICKAYLLMTPEQKKAAHLEISNQVLDKRTSDGTARVEQRLRSDKAPRVRTRTRPA